MKITSLLSDFRKWLDGEDAATLAPEQPKARSAWEEFLVAVAREVEVVMQQEMFTPPGGPTYIPREYIVFLSREDDAKWQGDKREGLERGLHHVLSERARELVNEREVQTKSFAVELRVDGTLEPGRFRVQPVWDSTAPKTEVRPRRKSEPAPAEQGSESDEATLSTAVPASQQADTEATIVRPRAPLFALAVSRDGQEPEIHRFHQARISVGRGSKDIRVDLQLEGDLEISRKQAVIEKLPEGKFAIVCEGRNPVMVSERELPPGERAEFDAQQKLRIGVWDIQVLEKEGDRPRTE